MCGLVGYDAENIEPCICIVERQPTMFVVRCGIETIANVDVGEKKLAGHRRPIATFFSLPDSRDALSLECTQRLLVAHSLDLWSSEKIETSDAVLSKLRKSARHFSRDRLQQMGVQYMRV